MRPSSQALVNAALLALCLAACASPEWQKPGASDAEREQALAECRAEARAATEREARIDQDITSTFQQDWQRAGVAESRRTMLSDRTRALGESIVERCMKAKGWVRGSES
jgi:hypothetical protein